MSKQISKPLEWRTSTHIFSISYMSDGANKSFTVRRALEALGEMEGQPVSLFFESRSWSNRNKSELNGQTWTDPNVYRHLSVRYREKLLGVHPDKGASGPGNTESFMMVRRAWEMLKGCYLPIIDLTQDSDSEDDQDDASSNDVRSEGESEEDEHRQEDGGGAVVIKCDNRTTDRASERGAKEDESVEAEHQQEHGGGSERDQTTEDMRAGGTVQPFTGKPSSKWDHMIGETFQKKYWFRGEVKTVRVAKVNGKFVYLHKVVYDDGDKEECSLDDLLKLRGDDDCKILVGNPGYKFWKEFLLWGEVTRIHYSQCEKGESMSCSC